MRRRKVSQNSGDALLNRDIAIVFFFFLPYYLVSCGKACLSVETG